MLCPCNACCVLRSIHTILWLLNFGPWPVLTLIYPVCRDTDTFQAVVQHAEQLKEEGNLHFRDQDWAEAFHKYTMAIEASPPGDDRKCFYYCNRCVAL